MKKRILTGFLSIGLLMFPAQVFADHHGGDHANHHAKMDHKTLVNHFYDVVMTQHKLEMAEHFIAADAIEHEQSMMTDPKKNTLENFKVMMQSMWKAFPDMKFTAVDTLVDGNRIMVIYRMTGTNTGDFMGMKATNKKIDITGVDIMKIDNGKFVEHWGFMDSMVMMQQLGMMH